MTNIAAERLTFSFETDRKLLRNLSLRVRPGELTVLLGGNGAGKTTLLRILAGHLKPDSGHVDLDGRHIGDWTPREIARRVSLMPQSERCEVKITVREMVRLGRVAQRGWVAPFVADDERAVDAAIEMVNIGSWQHQHITTLSGGQWRLAILARSLAQGASLLLLDEPTSGLDLRHQYECLSRVRDLVRRNSLTAIVTLHDLNQAAMFADRIAILHDGNVLAWGSPAEVLTQSLIRQTYGIDVLVSCHPVHGTPMIVPAMNGENHGPSHSEVSR